MSNATNRRFVVVTLGIVALAVTVWSAVAQAGPLPTPTATPTGKTVNFRDSNLEAAIRAAISKPTGPIKEADLATLTFFSASNAEISDISVLAGLTNLTLLTLSSNQISDLSSLAGLTNLEVLHLSNNQISDLSVLAGLTNLTSLSLNVNQISDLNALAGLTNLESLFLSHNQIRDISALVANAGIGSGDRIVLLENPLNEDSICAHIPALEARGVDVNWDSDGTLCPSPTSSPTPTATPVSTPTPTPFLDYCEIDIKCSVDGGPPHDETCFVIPTGVVTFSYDFIGGEAEIFDDQFGVIGIYTGTTLTRTQTISETVTHTATFEPIDTVCLTGIFSDSVTVLHAEPVPTAPPSATPSATPPTPTPTSTPTPTPMPADCLCEVTNINPDTLNLNKVGEGGKQSSETRRMNVQIRAVDAPGATCDLGETSGPVKINLRMVDDDGDVLIDSAKTAVCEKGGEKQMVRNVFVQPKNCKDSAVGLSGTSSGIITATGSAFGAPDYVEILTINCNE